VFNGTVNPQNWLSLATVLVAIAVPFLTFRLVSRQEHLKWTREQRLNAYVDFLTVINEIATFETPESVEADQGIMRYGSRRYSESAVRLSVVASPQVAARLDEFDAWFTAVKKWPVSNTAEPEFDQHYFALTTAMRRELGMHRGPDAPSRPRARDHRWRRVSQPVGKSASVSDTIGAQGASSET
jgi:hypothetical protein